MGGGARELAELSSSSSSSISSGSNAAGGSEGGEVTAVLMTGLKGICIWGLSISPSTITMWTASKCSSKAWRSLSWRPQQV